MIVQVSPLQLEGQRIQFGDIRFPERFFNDRGHQHPNQTLKHKEYT